MSTRSLIVAAVVFMALAAGVFIGFSSIYSRSIDDSTARDGSSTRPPVATSNPQGSNSRGTTGSNLPPASR